MDLKYVLIALLAIALGVIFLVWFVKGIFNLGKAFWSLFDHSIVPRNSTLSPDAEILDIRSKKVQYVKNGMKYKTTVYFSDGFQFVTHETEREDGILSYQISISPEQYKWMIESANEAHARALRKQQSRKK